jgi:cell division protein FtsB
VNKRKLEALRTRAERLLLASGSRIAALEQQLEALKQERVKLTGQVELIDYLLSPEAPAATA